MEGAGNESLLGHAAVSETADGDIGLAADVDRLLFYGVFLSSGMGCDAADIVVGGAVDGHLAHLPYTRQVDCRIAHSFGCSHHHEYGCGLLDLLSEVAWPFLCCGDRHYSGCTVCMAVQATACKISLAICIYVCQHRCALSADWHIWPFCHVADGSAPMAHG